MHALEILYQPTLFLCLKKGPCTARVTNSEKQLLPEAPQINLLQFILYFGAFFKLSAFPICISGLFARGFWFKTTCIAANFFISSRCFCHNIIYSLPKTIGLFNRQKGKRSLAIRLITIQTVWSDNL